MSATLTFYGGADAVTGSNFMIETGTGKVLIDCGLTQGSDELEARNWQPFQYDPRQVEVLLITHAHMDHIGLIGKLVAEGFRGKIYSTVATKDLARVMLADGLHIMQYEARQRKVEPLWNDDHLAIAFDLWETREYYDSFQILNDIVVKFSDAGHILGSAMVSLTSADGKTITFTGDLGNTPSVLLRDTDMLENSDYLVMEAVYGNRNHDDTANRQQQLKDIMLRAIDRGGPIIVPAFSLERTQVLLYELNEMIESGQLPVLPVFLDSPLAIKVLQIYEQHPGYFNEVAKNDIKSGDDIFSFPGLKTTETKMESKKINSVNGSKIIIAGAGMSHAGRIQYHELKYLDQSDATIIFVGYQAPGSVGRQIIEGNKYVRIMGRKIKVQAQVETLLSYSSHKDMQNLVKFARHASQHGTREIMVVLSEPQVAIDFTHRLQDDPAIKAKIITPELGEVKAIDW